MSLMAKVGKSLGAGATAAAGGLMGRAGNWLGDKIFGGSEDKRQLEQQRKLMQQQIAGQKDMGRFNQQLQEDMYNKYNTPEAKVKMLKDAGLSASLMYGGQGAGGATAEAGSAGQVTGGANADSPSSKLMASTQAQQMMANIELTKAQTEKTNAEKDNISGGIKEGLEQDNIAKKFQNEFNKDSREDNLRSITSYANKLLGEANEAGVKGAIAEGTQIEQQERIKTEAVGAMLNNIATIQGVKQSEEQIKKWSSEIMQKWEELRLKGENINIEKFKSEVVANTPGISGVLGGMVDGLFRALDQLTPGSPVETNRRRPN